MPISNRDTAVVVETNDLTSRDESLFVFHVVKESDKDKVHGGAMGIGRLRAAPISGSAVTLKADVKDHFDSFLPFKFTSEAISGIGKVNPQCPSFILNSGKGDQTTHTGALFGVFGIKEQCPMSVFCFSTPEENPIFVAGFTSTEMNDTTDTSLNHLYNRDFTANLHAHGDQ